MTQQKKQDAEWHSRVKRIRRYIYAILCIIAILLGWMAYQTYFI
jgi:hypothetical protein